ncbi:FkbM family methyltransferase [Litorivicinus sp.]|nr:FkbM family methyltransferase [Litorivicinus sp.]MDC1240110.1 FkbM family methyltransferase [Litorivicinus sp.]MDC1466322.1 FkbM family methyltransferase [Litorivicinus sp.]
MFHVLNRLLLSKAVFKASDEAPLLDRFFEGIEQGTFLDIGANAPESAVTLPYLQRGWSGLAIDPIPQNIERLKKAGFKTWCGAVTSELKALQEKAVFHIAGGGSGRKSSLDSGLIDPLLEQKIIEVPLSTLSDIIDHSDLRAIDLLSIDVEGCEFDVLDTLPVSFPVRLILVEDWARDSLIHQLLLEKQFKRVRRTGYNSWYVPIDATFNCSLWGQLHLHAKLSWFAPVRRWRFERKKRRILNHD